MQFTQKKIINILILILGLILLLIPSFGLVKSLYRELEEEIQEPQIIERDEIIEEIEYIDAPTISSSVTPTIKPNTNREIEDEEDDD